MVEPFRKAYIYIRDEYVGELAETDFGYSFSYDEAFLKSGHASAVSLTLPLSSKSYESNVLFSYFDGLIPEGWLLDVVSENRKIDYNDRFGLMLASCKDCVGNVSIREKKTDIKQVFGITDIQNIEIDEKEFGKFVAESVEKGITVPGVQKKVASPTGYILKPQVEEFECLPESEQLVMCMADTTGIVTVPHALVKSGDTLAYITKRVDRIIDKTGVHKLAMEDFCQLDMRSTADKYRGSYERCAKVIKEYSSQVGLDMAEFFMRLVFSFVTGNSDMHLKNFSLIENAEASQRYILSPAYDLLPVNIIMPEDTEELALTMNGKKTHISKKDFLIFADNCGISKVSAEKMIAGIVSKRQKYIEMCNDSLLPKHLKSSFAELIEKRCSILE